MVTLHENNFDYEIYHKESLRVFYRDTIHKTLEVKRPQSNGLQNLEARKKIYHFGQNSNICLPCVVSIIFSLVLNRFAVFCNVETNSTGAWSRIS